MQFILYSLYSFILSNYFAILSNLECILSNNLFRPTNFFLLLNSLFHFLAGLTINHNFFIAIQNANSYIIYLGLYLVIIVENKAALFMIQLNYLADVFIILILVFLS